MKRFLETFPTARPEELRDAHQQHVEQALSQLLASRICEDEKVSAFLEEQGFTFQKKRISFDAVDSKPDASLATQEQMRDVLENVFAESVEQLFPQESALSESQKDIDLEVGSPLEEFGVTMENIEPYFQKVLPKPWVPPKRILLDVLDAPTQRRVQHDRQHEPTLVIESAPQVERVCLPSDQSHESMQDVFLRAIPMIFLKESVKTRESFMSRDQAVRARYIKTAVALEGKDKVFFTEEVTPPHPFRSSTDELKTSGDRYEQVILTELFRLPEQKGKHWKQVFSQQLFERFNIPPKDATMHVAYAEELWKISGGGKVEAFQKQRDHWMDELARSTREKQEERLVHELPHEDLQIAVQDVLHVLSHAKIIDRSLVDHEAFSPLHDAWYSFLRALFRRHLSMDGADVRTLLRVFLEQYRVFVARASAEELKRFHKDAVGIAVGLRERFVA